MNTKLPSTIREAIGQVCEKGFHYKDLFRSFMLRCGVPSGLYDRYANKSRSKIASHILTDLDSLGEEGYRLQRRILTAFCNLRKLPDGDVPNPAAGLSAIRELRRLALDQKLVVRKKKANADARTGQAKHRQTNIAARTEKIRELRESFNVLAASPDPPHSRDSNLESILAGLFEVNEISYRPSYCTEIGQMEGSFLFKGFDYLVEAMWGKEPAVEADLTALTNKVNKRITSTRGLFISIAGFHSDVVMDCTSGVTPDLILMDGMDLSLILEEHVSLVDALDTKIEKAVQEGTIYFPLAQRFS